MNAPQVAMIVFFALEIGVVLAKNGEPKTGNYSIGMTLATLAILGGIMYWGGFFDGGSK